jgi:hypothetical protein
VSANYDSAPNPLTWRCFKIYMEFHREGDAQPVTDWLWSRFGTHAGKAMRIRGVGVNGPAVSMIATYIARGANMHDFKRKVLAAIEAEDVQWIKSMPVKDWNDWTVATVHLEALGLRGAVDRLSVSDRLYDSLLAARVAPGQMSFS